MDPTSSRSSRWEAKYKIPLPFLSDSQAELVYEKHPNLRRGICPTCNGTQSYRYRGEEHSCDCRRQIELHKHYLHANIGLFYQRLDWVDYQGDLEALKVTETWLDNEEKMRQNGIGLMYLGEFGVGKTLLSILLSKELIKMGKKVFFATFSEMIEMFTKSWVSDSARAEFEQKVVESEVFVLDDVGKEFRAKNNLVESTFDHVLRSRAVDARPTILTSNMSDGEISEGYGGAIFSLLSERAVVIEARGEDFRPRSRERMLQEVLQSEVRPIS